MWRLTMESSLHLRSVEPRQGNLKCSAILKSLGNPPQKGRQARFVRSRGNMHDALDDKYSMFGQIDVEIASLDRSW